MVNSFRTQLVNVTKSKEEVNNEALELLKVQTENEYSLIKEKLLEKAGSGQYTLEAGHKEIVLDYESSILENLITMTHKIIAMNRTLSNPSGDWSNEIIYEINEQEKYDLFVDTLEKLSKKDEVSITPLMLKYDKHYADKEFYEVPCVIQGGKLTTNSYGPILRCVVRY